MQALSFIQDLAVVLMVAGIVGWACQRIGLSAVVGYLAAGIIVGPYTPPITWITDVARIETLAQLGMVFLMFSIGLKLSLRKLRRLGLAMLAGIFGSALVVYYLTRLIATACGLSGDESVFLASMLMVSSSAIIGKVLQESGGSHDRATQLAMGVTVLEDVVAVVILTLLNAVYHTKEGVSQTDSSGLGVTLGTLGAFVAMASVAGLIFIPRFLRKLSVSAGEEVQTLGVTGLLFGLAVLAQRAGYSLALGAFLLGTIVAETPHRIQVDRTFEGMKDVFSAVFFVAIGMQIDIKLLLDSWWIIIVLAAFTLCVRSMAATAGLSMIGISVRDSLRTGLMVTTIGEFSFIIAQLGVEAGVISKVFYPVIVGVSLMTTLVAPSLTKNSGAIADWFLNRRTSWMRTWHENYYRWIEKLKVRQQRNLLWQLSRKRFLQIGLEMLLISGLLLFSRPMQALAEQWLGANWLFPNGLSVLFWFALTLVLVAPLLAVWRNISALSLLYAQVSVTDHPRAAQLCPIIERLFKAVAGVSLWIWISALIPTTPETKWLLPCSGIVAILALLFLRRKLVYWHSELETDLHETFSEKGNKSADTAAPWLTPYQDWNVRVSDCVLPDLAECQGRCIADLGLRARFGVMLAGIERQGCLIPLPPPETVLYPRDKVLLIGTVEQVAAGINYLTQASGQAPISDFEDVHMEVVTVPKHSQAIAHDLRSITSVKSLRVQIVGLRRAGLRTLNPGADVTIQEADELLVLGTSEQLRGFRDWLDEKDGTFLAN